MKTAHYTKTKGEIAGIGAGSGEYQYKTTCLTCGWHKDCGSSFDQIHDHVDECPKSVVVISVREKE